MQKQNWKFKLGLVLIILCMIIFFFIFFIPLLHTTDKNKIFIAGVAAVAAEVLFWTGGLLLGKQLLDKYRAYTKWEYWFNKKKEDGAEKQEDKVPADKNADRG
jgi:uncharacterized membrane protein